MTWGTKNMLPQKNSAGCPFLIGVTPKRMPAAVKQNDDPHSTGDGGGGGRHNSLTYELR